MFKNLFCFPNFECYIQNVYVIFYIRCFECFCKHLFKAMIVAPIFQLSSVFISYSYCKFAENVQILSGYAEHESPFDMFVKYFVFCLGKM